MRVDHSSQDEHPPSAGRGGSGHEGGGAIGENGKGQHHGVVGEPLPVAPGVGQVGWHPLVGDDLRVVRGCPGVAEAGGPTHLPYRVGSPGTAEEGDATAGDGRRLRAVVRASAEKDKGRPLGCVPARHVAGVGQHQGAALRGRADDAPGAVVL